MFNKPNNLNKSKRHNERHNSYERHILLEVLMKSYHNYKNQQIQQLKKVF